ncbi:Vegetative incompatibility protein HET-E-1 [Ceratobasidium sp. AG-Ba]|nr:Vegetative incompatibility protein HET-E-1 [Ceratobasidium sp. AG-Ba]
MFDSDKRRSAIEAAVEEKAPGDDNKNKPWKALKAALRGVKQCSKICPPLADVGAALVDTLDLIPDADRNHEEYIALASSLETEINTLEKYLKDSNSIMMSSSIQNTFNAMQDQIDHINRKQQRRRLNRCAEATEDISDIIECYRRIESYFRRLHTHASLSIWAVINEQTANARLDRLFPVLQARYNSSAASVVRRRGCTPTTRASILADIQKWSNLQDGPKIYWLNGMAGTGKTTIAYSVCEMLSNTCQLCASFFCSRQISECRDASRVIPTIVYQISGFSFPFRSTLCEILGNHRDISAQDIETQFDKLIKEPILAIKDTLPTNSVVVFDALDELVGESDAWVILDLLFRFAADLPIRFFVSSRPEPSVREHMLTKDLGTRAVLHLHDIKQSLVQADIKTFLTEELRFIGPSEDQVKRLAEQAGKLFIYAATAARYILPPGRLGDPLKRLAAILSAETDSLSKRHRDIDGLYSTILSAALEHPELEIDEADDIRFVLHTVVCAAEPLDIKTLAKLLVWKELAGYELH